MVNRHKLLIVDDAPSMRMVLANVLRHGGYDWVEQAADGAAALACIEREAPALMLLDVSMPVLSGFDVVERLRARGEWLPVLMLTNYDDLDHRVRGLSAGADDYVSKLCDSSELLARVSALLRRTAPSKGGRVLRLGPTLVDLEARRAERAGRPLALSETEFALLDYLARAAGRPVSQEELLKAVWGYVADMDTRTVEMQVCRLRKKICTPGTKPRWLVNRCGLGYVLNQEEGGTTPSGVATAAEPTGVATG